MNEKLKIWLVLIGFFLFSAILLGAFYLFTTPGQTVNVAFAYVVGLSMIVLPCTLPLAFVIVPLAMGKSPKKGLLMSVYFGLGLAITLSIYGLVMAMIGKSLGLDEAINSASSVSKILFMVGGLAAFIFGLSELKLIKFKIPSFTGSYPKIIQEQGDYLKAFFLGLFLGNAGVGCPNPLFYVLLGDIALVADPLNGWWLGFIHGIGRATPLIFLTILGILGVNAVSKIASKTALVTKITGISLIFLGAFIFISGASHNWYENGPIHRGWNNVVQMVAGDKIVEREASADPGETPVELQSKNEDHEDEEDYIPAPWSWITLILMIIIPIVWYQIKNKKSRDNKNNVNEQKNE